jgi:hypothetical protein
MDGTHSISTCGVSARDFNPVLALGSIRVSIISKAHPNSQQKMKHSSICRGFLDRGATQARCQIPSLSSDRLAALAADVNLSIRTAESETIRSISSGWCLWRSDGILRDRTGLFQMVGYILVFCDFDRLFFKIKLFILWQKDVSESQSLSHFM